MEEKALSSKNLPHPIAGRWGYGHPFAPPGWLWRAGLRLKDMYFTSPRGKQLRSQVQLNEYLLQTGAASPSDFQWNFSPNDYKDGTPLPGNPPETRPTLRKRRPSNGTMETPRMKQQKLIDRNRMQKEGDQPAETVNKDPQGVVTPIPPPTNEFLNSQSRLRKFSRLDENDLAEVQHEAVVNRPIRDRPSRELRGLFEDEVVKGRRRCRKRTPLQAQNGFTTPPSVGSFIAPTTNGQTTTANQVTHTLTSILSSSTSHIILADPGVLNKFLEEAVTDKTDAELGDLRELVVAKSKDTRCLEKHPLEALRVFFYILRGEDPPSVFGVKEISKMCSKWTCNFQRSWCFREAAHIQILTDMIQQQQGNAGLDLEERSKLETFAMGCKCEPCSGDPTFCSGCSCNLCKGVLHSKLNWSYLRCENCCHVAHLDCALKAKRAGVFKEFDLDVEYLCASCVTKNDLVPFWKTRIKDALALVDRPLLDKHLSAAVRVMNGTQKPSYQVVHARLKALQDAILCDQDCSDMQTILTQVVDSLDQLDVFLGYDDSSMDQSIVAEILEGTERQPTQLDVDEETRKCNELEKEAEVNYAAWLSAQKLAESRRCLLRQMQEQLDAAEMDAKLQAGVAKVSRTKLQRSQRKVQVLEILKRAEGVPKSVVDLQRWIFNEKLKRMQVLQQKILNCKCDNITSFLQRMDGLLAELNAQDKKVKAEQAKLEHLIFFQKLAQP